MAGEAKGGMADRVQLLHVGHRFDSRGLSRALRAVPAFERVARDQGGKNFRQLRLRRRLGALLREDDDRRRLRQRRPARAPTNEQTRSARRNIAWRKPTRRCCASAGCASRSKCTPRECRWTRPRNFFRRIATTKKNRRAPKRCAAHSIPAISTTRSANLQILKLRDDYEAQEGENFSLQKFHDELLNHGMPPDSPAARNHAQGQDASGTRCCR